MRLHFGTRAAGALAILLPSIATAQEIDFDRDIRPMLARRCFQCHGPDQDARQAGLRFDVRASAFEDRGGYAAIVAGDAEASELIRRVFSDNPSVRMPPPDSKLTLTESEKELLRKWIVEGATWNEHWSFVRPTRPALPDVQLHDWCINPIDHFILARLEGEGLAASRRATKETLVRRVTLDLTGLPPTPDEVLAFLADNSPTAYEKVVDRLLNSSRYGQRMAWEWLDAARYADTDGFQGDPTRSMWPWRDWLVDALNDNMPFDQFTIEMLAGDLLPDATDEQILATGFNRNHMYNGEGGRIAEETRVENVFDRTETTATVWLGLTMTCARCHDHKFDPITQAEYYGLYAFFNNTSETGKGGTRGSAAPSRPYLTPTERGKVAHLNRQIAELVRRMNSPIPQVDRAQLHWEAEVMTQNESLANATEAVTLANWLQAGPIPSADAHIAQSAIERVLKQDAVIAPIHPDHPWQLRQDYVDGTVQSLPSTVGTTFLLRTITAKSARSIELSLGSDDGITVWLNGGQPVLDNQVTRVAAPDQEKLVLNLHEGANLLLLRIRNTGGIAGFYFQKTNESASGLPPDLAKIVATKSSERTSKQQHQLTQFYRSQHWPEWQDLDRQREELQNLRDKIVKAAPAVMVMDELPHDKRRATKILDKGIYNKPTDIVVAEGTPSILHPLPDEASYDRLDLAEWIVSEENPLTARVIVNRYWQQFFGKGLVATPEDFGQTGVRPTHPQLLDWLAAEFMESGWNVKEIHRCIVTSATYCQSSAMSDGLVGGSKGQTLDPNNELCWHAPRFRLPAWMLRDQALAVSELLNEKVGGPSVKPYQPDGVWAEATFGKIRYDRDEGDALFRRSLYVFWRRIVGPTMFFDVGKRQTCEVMPRRTNTPLHALTTLNETTFVEAARNMAERVLLSPGESNSERLEFAYRRALGRSLQAQERAVLLKRLDQLSDYYAEHLDEAHELLGVGESVRDTSLAASAHAAWTVTCSTIMNLDEFMTRE